MPTVPSLTTWGPTGTITATVVNNNFSAIRTYVNTYCAFLDQNNTFTGTTQTFPAIVATSGTFSGTIQGAGSIQSVAGSVTCRLASDSGNSWATIGTYSNHNLKFVSNSLTRGQLTSSGTFELDTLTAVTLTATGTTTLGATTTGALTSGAITATGNSTITGTLGGVTTLTCTTVTATNLGGTLTTAAQANVTSLGTLTALTVSGVTVLRLTGGGAKIGEATSTGDFFVGPQSAIATSATGGFLILPGCNGTPSGAPGGVSGTNGFPMVIDYNTSKIWVCFNGTWRATAALT